MFSAAFHWKIRQQGGAITVEREKPGKLLQKKINRMGVNCMLLKSVYSWHKKAVNVDKKT